MLSAPGDQQVCSNVCTHTSKHKLPSSFDDSQCRQKFHNEHKHALKQPGCPLSAAVCCYTHQGTQPARQATPNCHVALCGRVVRELQCNSWGVCGAGVPPLPGHRPAGLLPGPLALQCPGGSYSPCLVRQGKHPPCTLPPLLKDPNLALPEAGKHVNSSCIMCFPRHSICIKAMLLLHPAFRSPTKFVNSCSAGAQHVQQAS